MINGKEGLNFMAGLQVIELQLTDHYLLNFDALNRLTHHLLNRGLAMLPTETGYLLAANALDAEAVKKVFKVKERQMSNPIHAVVSGLEMAEQLVYLESGARKLCNRFLPGPLTVICPKRPIVPDLLVANTGNLGIRVPDCPVTLQVVQAFGKPITATSFNLSGKSSEESVEDTIAGLNWKDENLVYLVKEHSSIAYDKPSTLVTFATKPWSILREGPVKESEISAAINALDNTDV